MTAYSKISIAAAAVILGLFAYYNLSTQDNQDQTAYRIHELHEPAAKEMPTQAPESPKAGTFSFAVDSESLLGSDLGLKSEFEILEKNFVAMGGWGNPRVIDLLKAHHRDGAFGIVTVLTFGNIGRSDSGFIDSVF